MALTNQPYLPLYVKDLLTNPELIECSAAAHGVYFRLLCVLHKQSEYGVILLKQKHKQTDKQVLNFALMLARTFPFEVNEIESCLKELLIEKVLFLEGDKLYQRRMVRDAKLSVERAKHGTKGGKKTQKFARANAKANNQAKVKANTVNAIVIENDIVSSNKKGVKSKKEPKIEIVLPWQTERFEKLWNEYKAILKKKKKFVMEPDAEQRFLLKLQKGTNGNEEFAIELVTEAKDNQWKRVVYPDQKFNSQKNGQSRKTFKTVEDVGSAMAAFNKVVNPEGRSKS